MKEKGGLLNDFKLYYESLPSEPKAKRVKTQKPKNKHITNILDANIYSGLNLALAYFLVFHRQRPVRNKSTILTNIDDRKIMPKVPRKNKASKQSIKKT